MSESKWREAVAEALCDRYTRDYGEHGIERPCEGHLKDADALSPVLAQMKREWQVEALREAADAALDHYGTWGGAGWADWLRDRAEASGQEGER